ncbi:MAG: hypothetical protein KZQ83_06265 [gamma proteobacterium symbiont of Taylorina sp.]|nr:hypothetical protein [gamma proteobacterium symbiont of Taylorina sp.]
MKTRRFFILITLITTILLLPLKGFTLGFGAIKVLSNINEPLRLQIELLDSRSINIDDLIVRNASKEVYRQSDLERSREFTQVKFKAIKRADGSVYLDLSSKKPFRELYITFIADLNWKNIHLNREYTFFLDPPVLKKKKVTKKKSSTTQQQKKSVTSHRKRKQSYTSRSSSNPIQSDSYYVQRSDTLSHIAQRARPDKSVTAFQTMKALFSLNPDAFINNNINLLKQGYTLTIPSKEEILQLSQQTSKPKTKKQALSKTRPADKKTPEVVEHQSLTSQEESSTPDKESSTPEEKSSTPDKESSTLEEKSSIPDKESSTLEDKSSTPDKEPSSTGSDTPQLKIVPPSEELLAKHVDDDVLELMARTLKTSHETITILQKENTQLSNRIEELTQKLNNFDEKNKDLSNKIDRITRLLEQQAAQSLKASDQLNRQAIDSRQNSKPLAIESQNYSAANKGQSFFQQIMAYPEFLFIFLVSIILLFAVIIMMQKRSNTKKDVSQASTANNHIAPSEKTSSKIQVKSDNEDSAKGNSEFSDYFNKNIIVSTETQAQTNAGDNNTEIELDLDLDLDEVVEDPMSVESLSSGKPALENEAVLREVNTFIAYGKYDGAEKLLQAELEKSPYDKSLHTKLFELYSDTGRADDFKIHLKKISQLLNSDSEFSQQIEKIYQQTRA